MLVLADHLTFVHIYCEYLGVTAPVYGLAQISHLHPLLSLRKQFPEDLGGSWTTMDPRFRDHLTISIISCVVELMY